MEARAATDHKTWEGSWLPGPCPLGNSNLASQPVQVADVGRVQVEVDQVDQVIRQGFRGNQEEEDIA